MEQKCGTKLCAIKDLAPGETTDFRTEFNFDNVDHLGVSIVDEPEAEKIGLDKLKWDSLGLDKIPRWAWLFAIWIVIPGLI